MLLDLQELPTSSSIHRMELSRVLALLSLVLPILGAVIDLVCHVHHLVCLLHHIVDGKPGFDAHIVAMDWLTCPFIHSKNK